MSPFGTKQTCRRLARMSASEGSATSSSCQRSSDHWLQRHPHHQRHHDGDRRDEDQRLSARRAPHGAPVRRCPCRRICSTSAVDRQRQAIRQTLAIATLRCSKLECFAFSYAVRTPRGGPEHQPTHPILLFGSLGACHKTGGPRDRRP
jgi:hypothetical protein